MVCANIDGVLAITKHDLVDNMQAIDVFPETHGSGIKYKQRK